MVLIRLLLHRLLYVLLVLRSSVSLLLHRGAEVSNDLVSPYDVGVISIEVTDDDDVVSITGTTSTHMVITGAITTHMVIGGVPVHTSTPPSCIVLLTTRMLRNLSLSNTLTHLPRCLRSRMSLL